MIAEVARAELRELLGERVRFDAPLARCTSLRVGGPADALAVPQGRSELARLLGLCARHRIAHLVLGNGFNTLVLTDIYPAGEDKIPGVEAASLAEAVRAHGHRDVRFVAELDGVVEALPGELEAGDLVVTLGAGSVSSLGPRLLRALGERSR